MPRFELLQDWLSWQETLHPATIDLGLERVARVFNRLYSENFKCPVITVAGTNGKGSSIRLLESIYLAAGYKTASYTSPHLLRYNERIRLDGKPVEDQRIVNSFQRIDAARGDVSLTYFEFGTLAAFDIFMQHPADVVLLEVGLGGRLDAVNIINTDVALLTSIALDHTEWLGADREAIGREKAGIIRAGKPVVCSDLDLPQSILQVADDLGAPLYRLGQEFSFDIMTKDWNWRQGDTQISHLPPPALSGRHQYRNAAGVLMAISLLVDRLPVAYSAISQGLATVHLSGRFETVVGRPNWIYDVAHNPDSIRELAGVLADTSPNGHTYALLGMLADKDTPGALNEIKAQIDYWHIAALPTPRTEQTAALQKTLVSMSVPESRIVMHSDVPHAWEAISHCAQRSDRVVIFGSFYTVAEAMKVAQGPVQRI